MSGFIQTISYTTTRIDEIRALGEQLREKRTASGETPKPLQISFCADRDVPNRYTTVVEFASHEDAMANSDHPDVGEFAARMAELCDGPPTFTNLDVLDQHRP